MKDITGIDLESVHEDPQGQLARRRSLRVRLLTMIGMVCVVVLASGGYGVGLYLKLLNQYHGFQEKFEAYEAVQDYREGLLRLTRGIDRFDPEGGLMALAWIESGSEIVEEARQELEGMAELTPESVSNLMYWETELRVQAKAIENLAEKFADPSLEGTSELEASLIQLQEVIAVSRGIEDRIDFEIDGVDRWIDEVIEVTGKQIHHDHGSLFWTGIWGMSIPVIVLVIFSVAISARVYKPVEELAKGVRAISKGTYQEISVCPTSPKEVQALGFAFNELIHSLKQNAVSRQFMEALLDSLPVAVTICDKDRSIVYANQAVKALTGLSPERIKGRQIADVLCPIPEVCSEAGLSDPKEYTVLRGENEIVPILASVSSFDPKGRQARAARYIVVATDIREQKRIEEEILQAKAEAEKASRAKSEFLANMSHEIRTPLNGVLGMLQLLMQNYLDEEQMEFARSAESSARSLVSIINDILDLAKIEAGKLEIRREPCDLRELISAAAQPLRIQASQKDVSLEVSVDHRVQPRLLIDPLRVRQVLVNLIGNAVKFTEQGRIGVSIKVDDETADRQLISFTVADTGIGIERERVKQIFEVFEQGDSSVTKEYGGTGLGLSISSQLVSRMNGTLSVESVKGEGSTFAFVLPLEIAVEAPAEGTKFHSPKKDTQRRRNSGSRILMAEDNSANQIIVKMALEAKGYNLAIVENGREVVEEFFQNPYDLILMDIQMPGVSGIDAAAMIRKREEDEGRKAKVPIVALTAHAFTEMEEKCSKAGMNGFIRKPFSLEDLYAVLDSFLGAHHTSSNSDSLLLFESGQKFSRDELADQESR